MAINKMTLFCLAGLLAASQAVNAEDNLKFTGTILPPTCDVDAASAEQTVNLGEFSSGNFPTPGTTTAATKFQIKLKDCGNGATGSKVWFSGTGDNDDPTLLALSDTGTGNTMATGIGVQILNKDQQPVSINNTEATVNPVQAGDNTLDFYLRYKSTKSAVTAGNATAVMYFDLTYQ